MWRSWLLFALMSGCGGGSGDVDARPPGPCNDVTVETSPPAGMHVPTTEQITWPTNPPSGGPH